jgi:glutamate-1-semialdehyde 2,1-aminomutase
MLVNLGEQSRALRERALAHVPGGVHSNVRLSASEFFFTRGSGSRLWDADGKEYIDYALGQGPMLLGHSNASIDGAVAMACTQGMIYAGQHPLEVVAAERFCSAVKWADQLRFGMTGTEVVQAALRAARAATGRSTIIRAVGHYHGWSDSILLDMTATSPVPGSAGQLPEALGGTTVVPWDDVAAVETALAECRGDVAAIILEPVMLNTGAREPSPGYLESLRRICTENDIVLIFDEVITGFRLALGGAAEYYGVEPDLATYGKAMAGGWPVAAFAGRAHLLEGVGKGSVNHAGTFNASVMATAAVVATLSILEADPPYDRLRAYGDELMPALVQIGERHGIPLRVTGVPMAFTVTTDPDFLSARDLHHELAASGLWTTTRGLWFLSDAHREVEFQETLERFDAALGHVAAGTSARVAAG